MNEIKVSVIVPVYNVDKYLKRCIDSLVNQEFDSYEVILVNDGSTDTSPEICDEYASKYDFIKVFHKPNGGVSSARNLGIDNAQGEYIMFVDSDDYVTNDYISTMYECQIANPDHMIVCNVYKKNENDTEYKKVINNFSNEVSYYNKDDYYELYKTNISGALWNKIFSSSILKKNTILFDESTIIGEDADFVCCYYTFVKGFIIIPKPLYFYIILNNGASAKYRKDKFHKSLKSFTCRLPLISQKDLPEFCDIYLYAFISYLGNTFDKRNTDSFYKKIKYNNSILKSEEFIYCLDHASKKNESPKFIKLLKKKNYLWIYLNQKIKSTLKI